MVKGLKKLLLWLVVAVILLMAVDQFMTRVHLNLPGLNPTRTFYLDFRARLWTLLIPENPTSDNGKIDSMIAEAEKKSKAGTTQATRFFYVDDNGILQFADSLQQVPQKFRQAAQPLAE